MATHGALSRIRGYKATQNEVIGKAVVLNTVRKAKYDCFLCNPR